MDTAKARAERRLLSEQSNGGRSEFGQIEEHHLKIRVNGKVCAWLYENCYAMTFGGYYGYKEGYNCHCKSVR